MTLGVHAGRQDQISSNLLMRDAVVPQPSAPGSCESAGEAADGAISFKMALSVVMSKRRIEEGLEVLCDIFICFEECCYQLILTCQVCLASVFSVVLSLSTPTE